MSRTEPHYQDVLRYAVREAETRAPGVQYDVIAMLPAGADAAVAQRRATDVMRGIMAQGVPASRIHLGLRAAQAGGAAGGSRLRPVKDCSPFVRVCTDGKRRSRPID